jgi:raffinose/stachyose/melibiose transport system substrate-binding protein
MKIMSRKTAIFAMAATVAIALSACGSSGGGTSADGGTGHSDQALLLWEPATEVAAIKPMITAFQASTGIKVNTLVFPSNGFENDLLTKWAAGNRPDIMLWHAIGNWLVAINPEQNLQDLSSMPFVQKTPANVLDNSVRYDGKTWAALLDVPQVDLLDYNKKVFAKLGLPVPQNFSQLLSTCQTIKQKDPGVTPIALGGGDSWPVQIPAFMMFNSALKTNPGLIKGINSNTVHFTDPPFLQGFQAEQELQQQGCFNKDDLSMTYNQSVQDLMEGKAAMEFSVGPAALYPDYSVADINSTEGVTAISYSSNVASWQEAGSGFYLPKTGNSQREAEAKQFVNFVTGSYYQTYLNSQKEEPLLTGFKAPAGIPQPYVTAYQLLQRNSVPQYQQDLQANYSDLFKNWLVAMLGGKMTPHQVGQNLQNSFAQNAQQVGLKGF